MGLLLPVNATLNLAVVASFGRRLSTEYYGRRRVLSERGGPAGRVLCVLSRSCRSSTARSGTAPRGTASQAHTRGEERTERGASGEPASAPPLRSRPATPNQPARACVRSQTHPTASGLTFALRVGFTVASAAAEGRLTGAGGAAAAGRWVSRGGDTRQNTGTAPAPHAPHAPHGACAAAPDLPDGASCHPGKEVAGLKYELVGFSAMPSGNYMVSSQSCDLTPPLLLC